MLFGRNKKNPIKLTDKGIVEVVMKTLNIRTPVRSGVLIT